ncbi:MAG: hypothetical protein IPP83_11930 [Flavobacteriales bacterium]|nr:hypothetical protein [Flavobacteriales bacterium]
MGAKKKKVPQTGDDGAAKELNSVYDTATPQWNAYYRALRKRIRFPRYYKRAVNW